MLLSGNPEETHCNGGGALALGVKQVGDDAAAAATSIYVLHSFLKSKGAFFFFLRPRRLFSGVNKDSSRVMGQQRKQTSSKGQSKRRH